jgi:hypothetical protein
MLGHLRSPQEEEMLDRDGRTVTTARIYGLSRTL